jgi:metal-responsive CopG/Arc/MetJ family transcriptional regulator
VEAATVEKKPVLLELDRELLDAVEDFRHARRLTSRAAAIREMLREAARGTSESEQPPRRRISA